MFTTASASIAAWPDGGLSVATVGRCSTARRRIGPAEGALRRRRRKMASGQGEAEAGDGLRARRGGAGRAGI